MKKLIVLCLLSVCSLSTISIAQTQSAKKSATANPSASLDQDLALLRQDIKSGRKQLIAASLQLTDAEATKFWPVYDQYTAEQSKLGDEKVALIKEYAK